MLVAPVSMVIADPGAASRINAIEEPASIQERYCAELNAHLSRAKLNYACAPTPGMSESARRVRADPREIAFGQLDAFAREAAKVGDPEAFIIIRNDDVRQCLFAVTRHKDLQSFGELSVLAPHLRFFLPPQGSSSADTFRIVQNADAKGVGQAKSVEHAAKTEDAIRLALSAEDTVAFFVQFPDPESAPLKLVRELGGHFVPIIDREILRLQIDGRKLYFAQETQVANPDWLASGQKLVTSCTPMVLFTGHPAKLTDPASRQDHEDMIATARALRTDALLPQESAIARVLKRTKELSASSAEQLIRASEQARERVQPYIESAKEAADKALEAAKPALERAKELGIKALEKAREELKELTRPDDKPAEQPKN
jgi:hypothetical protein